MVSVLLQTPALALGLLTALWLAAAPVAVDAREMAPPRLTSARVDWAAVLRALEAPDTPRPAAIHQPADRMGRGPATPPALARLNAAMWQRLPGIAQSPVPVLVPFDTDALLRDLEAGTAPDPAAGNQRYLSGFHRRPFFFSGPSGYDASFALHAADLEDLNDIKYPEPFQILISGSLLLYELEDNQAPQGTPVAELDDALPGIRRQIHEHHLRYTFVRFGVPYVASIACFDAGVARYRMPRCRDADRVVRHFLGALRVAGGAPRPARNLDPIPIERPAKLSPSFSYTGPGRLLPDTGVRGYDGRADRTVYSQIRFPLLDAPAFVNSQLFQRRNRPVGPGHRPNYSYPWRDSFCENRGFPVGQCPGGRGHQGVDLRPALCDDGGEPATCRPHDLVAVRDGAIMRSPGQEAVYLFVNTEREHLRFRYLHMDPRRMDEDGLLSGRTVRQGEVIAQMSNFSRRPAGTSYHLHFDVQVPTRHGWVFVNPYMTLVAAYERLIGARGEELPDPTEIATTDKNPAALGTGKRAEREHVRSQRVKKRSPPRRGKGTRRGKRR